MKSLNPQPELDFIVILENKTKHISSRDFLN